MIKRLDKNTADKIAAGEVVDRPLSVVKELVENAIDAGASSITIEIKNGGKTYIRVTDNGSGIPADETELAFERHATSKISNAQDLQQIETLGFRGEALASITAVSRTEIITKVQDEKLGTKLVIEGSEIAENTATGCPTGTTIIVRDLFYNTPARLKFMKSDSAESSQIIEFISQIALAYTRIKIRMVSNNVMLFSTQGKGDRYQNILTVYSKEISNSLIPVAAQQEGGLALEGYISSPGISKASRRNQIFFVNGRVVNSKVIEKGIGEAYADKLFDGRHPIAFLFLRTDPHTLDVNIHPNKREVRFHDEKVISEFIHKTLREALLSKEAIPEIKSKEPAFKQKTPLPADRTFPPVSTQERDQVDIKKLLSSVRAEEKISENAAAETTAPYTTAPQEPAPVPQTPKPFDFDELTIIDSIFGTYILARDDTCFYMIDQHAAHERILFEQLMEQYRQKEKQRQILMIPITLQVSHGVMEHQDDWLDSLQDMGFSIDAFGPKTYRVKEIPAFMELDESERFLDDFMDQINEQTHAPAIEKIILQSCKRAVKAHDYLSTEEIDRLMVDLKRCENPFSCPHGRPTFVKMTQYEIERMFKRV